MGIKHFWRWFQTNFKTNISRLREGENVPCSINNLMIDMNGIFHNSTQKVYEYGNHKPPRRLLGRGGGRGEGTRQANSFQMLQLKVFEDVCVQIEQLVEVVAPSKRIIMCVDGPAPRSKQNQQRQRRFKSALERSSGFDSNSITPGTKFMEHLSRYIEWYIRKRISESELWRSIEVIFSNEKVPGEGEHKLINYIRKFGVAGDTYCLTGNDADLIMLALGTHVPDFYILREDSFDPANKYFFIDISTARIVLAELMKWTSENFKHNSTSAVNDFIFLCFMVGNDFLPHIPSIEIIEDGIELIIQTYKETACAHGHIMNIETGNLNPVSLGHFFDIISNHEKELLEQKLSRKQYFFPDPVLESSSTLHDKGVRTVDIDMFRNTYMSSSFPVGENIEKICHAYFEGMQWVISYYTRGVPNWRWFYPYHYAPSAKFLAQYANTFVQPKYGQTEPISPFQQLLCVLPPKSASLLPRPLSNLLTDLDSPLKKYCPDNIVIDLAGKRREWEGIVVLPIIDFNIIEKVYTANMPHVEIKAALRDKFGTSKIFYYQPNYKNEYKSYYGNIEACHTRYGIIHI